MQTAARSEPHARLSRKARQLDRERYGSFESSYVTVDGLNGCNYPQSALGFIVLLRNRGI